MEYTKLLNYPTRKLIIWLQSLMNQQDFPQHLMHLFSVSLLLIFPVQNVLENFLVQ